MDRIRPEESDNAFNKVDFLTKALARLDGSDLITIVITDYSKQRTGPC